MPMQQNDLVAAFQRRLQSDPRLLAEFLISPLGVMRREGVQVSPQAAMQLRESVAAAASTKRQP